VRTRVSEISQVGRNTQGVTLIRLPEDEKLVGVVKIEKLGDEEPGEAVGEVELGAANPAGVADDPSA